MHYICLNKKTRIKYFNIMATLNQSFKNIIAEAGQLAQEINENAKNSVEVVAEELDLMDLFARPSSIFNGDIFGKKGSFYIFLRKKKVFVTDNSVSKYRKVQEELSNSMNDDFGFKF